jgi:hypothetical protein
METDSNIMLSVQHGMRRWHGNYGERFANIDNLVRAITTHQPAWTIPADLLEQLTDSHSRLQKLIERCHTSLASRDDRIHRNTLLSATVSLCRVQIKIWAYGAYAAGVLTAADVHLLGFLLPGETVGRRSRGKASDVKAEVKVRVVNEDFIRVILDHSAGENAAQVAHGWPPGVRLALIVIHASDGVTEVYRQITSRLHTEIHMPDGSHGKQFVVKASFLKHVNDEPFFGAEQTFSMPLTTADLLAETLTRQHYEEREAHLQEIERLRREVERLTAELKARKNNEQCLHIRNRFLDGAALGMTRR